MCQYQATDGVAGSWHPSHYASLARGGAGLVIVEATGVAPEGRISAGCLGLWNDEQAVALQSTVNLVHEAGSKIAIQLAHAGRKASVGLGFPGQPRTTISPDAGGWQTVGPSPVAFTGYRTPQELTVDEIQTIITQFRDAARRAVEIGFDAIELHGAHGYLLHEFMSPLSNFRDDAYGGDVEGRTRLVREIVRGIREDHPDIPLLVRLSASEWREGGFAPEDNRELAARLAEDGADLIDVSSGGNIGDATIKIGPAYQAPFAHTVREAGLPVSAVGLITSAEQAETLLGTGVCDVVMIGREALRNPHTPIAWAKQLRSDTIAEIVPHSYHRAWPA